MFKLLILLFMIKLYAHINVFKRLYCISLIWWRKKKIKERQKTCWKDQLVKTEQGGDFFTWRFSLNNNLFNHFKVNKSRCKQYGVTPHFSSKESLLKKLLRKGKYWQELLVEKIKYWHNHSRKAFWWIRWLVNFKCLKKFWSLKNIEKVHT